MQGEKSFFDSNIFCFLLVKMPNAKENCFKPFFPCRFHKDKKIEEHFYINIYELINIHISADGHPITFV